MIDIKATVYRLAQEKIDLIASKIQEVATVYNMSDEQKTSLSEMMNEISAKLHQVTFKIVETNEFDGEVDRDTRSIISLRKGVLKDLPRLKTVLFHELVHAAGGKELDCEILELVYCTIDKNTKYSAPDSGDFADFASTGGKWFSYNSTTKKASFQGTVLPWALFSIF